MPKLCAVDGCGLPSRARGWCMPHYQRWWRWGDPEGNEWAPEERARQFWGSVERRGPDECWPWMGTLRTGNYGVFLAAPGAPTSAHRYAYELVVGAIPDGLDLGHRCHDWDLSCPGGPCHHRLCCNPAHLEPQTRQENLAAGRGNAAKTHCPRGHAYDEANTYCYPSGERHCRACEAQRQRAKREAIRCA